MLGDVRKKEDWRQALGGMDAVMHLASYMDYHPDFSTYFQTNVESIALLFEIILEDKLPIQKIIASSSQSVYGEGKYQCVEHGLIYPPPRDEAQLARHEWEHFCPKCGREMTSLPEDEDDLLNPQTPYGISKLSSEYLLVNLGKRYDVPTVALRYSIALGPYQSFRHFYSGALRAFTVNALNNEPIAMNEDARQTRDFVDVADVAAAHLVVLDSPQANFQSFNVGSGRVTRVMELAEMVAKVSAVEFSPHLSNRYRVGDGRNAGMKIDKLKALGWDPKHNLEETVRSYVDWVKGFGNLKEVMEKNYQQLEEQGILKTRV